MPSRTLYICVHPELGTQKMRPSVSVPSMSKIITDRWRTRALSDSRSWFIARAYFGTALSVALPSLMTTLNSTDLAPCCLSSSGTCLRRLAATDS